MAKRKVKDPGDELMAFTVRIPKRVVAEYVSERVLCGGFKTSSEKSFAEAYIDRTIQEALRNYYFKTMLRETRDAERLGGED